MTPEQRIEAACKARETETSFLHPKVAKAILEAAFPEYFDGTHVLVPMSILQGPGRDDKFVLVPREPTEAIYEAEQ